MSAAQPGGRGAARAGLNGTTTGFEPHTFDLSAYAGQTILLAFRFVSDGSVNEGGLIRQIQVHNWNVRLVGINDGRWLPIDQLALEVLPASVRRTPVPAFRS